MSARNLESHFLNMGLILSMYLAGFLDPGFGHLFLLFLALAPLPAKEPFGAWLSNNPPGFLIPDILPVELKYMAVS